MTGGRGIKATLRWAHRWFGLSAGLVLVVLGVSGSLLLFQSEYFAWAHGRLIPDHLSQQLGSIDRWVAQARAAVPKMHGPVYIWSPQTDHNLSDAAMLMFQGNTPGGFGHMGAVSVLVAPATGEVLGTIDLDRSPAYAPIFLHRDLWSGHVGRVLSGSVGVAALVMLPVGLYLWWPRTRLLQKLSLRPWRHTLTHAGRLHDVTGAWVFLVLLMLVGSGVYLVQPGWVQPALSALFGPERQVEAAADQTCKDPGAGPIGFDTAVARASEIVPSERFSAAAALDRGSLLKWKLIFAPQDSQATFRQTYVLADLRCGIVKLDSSPANRPLTQSIELWLISLHDGTALGRPGQILIALVGLAPLVLLWSGTRMWLRRRGWLRRPKQVGDSAFPKERHDTEQTTAT
jgi:uncharacterized iron-regulated membrane protein